MSDPVPTNLVMTPELQKAIADATDPEALKALVRDEVFKQANATQTLAAEQAAAETARLAAAETARKETEAAATRDGFSRIENIGGREYEFTADTQEELDQVILNAYRVAFNIQADAHVEEQIVDPVAQQAAADAAAAAEIVAKADLDRRFKAGEISAADYIEQSGALRDYLDKQGIPLDALRASVEQSQGTAYEQSWAQATETFLRSPAGATWPGDDRNRELMGMKIIELGLVDAPDKATALAQAFGELRRTNMLFQPVAEDPAAAEAARVAAAAAAAETARLAAAETARIAVGGAAPVIAAATASTSKLPATSSSLFGVGGAAASGGAPAVTGAGATERAVAPQFVIDPKATPAEILDAWKAYTIAQGRNPDDAFKEHYASKRI